MNEKTFHNAPHHVSGYIPVEQDCCIPMNPIRSYNQMANVTTEKSKVNAREMGHSRGALA
jgi:hypothetical protein